MNTFILAVFAAIIAVGLAANANECHLVDCGNTYRDSTKETCVAVAEWEKCVLAQSTEQDGLCNALGIESAKLAVKAASKVHGCGASAIQASIFGSLIIAAIAFFFRS
ncbi:hypothetical protein LOTGIDRAFT_233451 [Lottia gigantea]|uniref:UPAR/Ly6 domain-containing protein n=1 Tax=Lottia gigantea TaxID=225164 RepID=V3ZK68_LOTGI|nr:hypothetical protein LOTGIDRAFT_233451 [Lottia gigantea]ESO91698.1 hypothetical protein LOTGIDRAFT_233451 [Lottia gigantea]